MNMAAFNQIVFQWIHQFAGRNIIVDDLGIFFAAYLPYLLMAGFLALALYEKGWRRKIYVLIEGSLAIILARGVIAEVIQFFYHHPRPFLFYNFAPLISESGSSFPSGHASWFFAVALVVWYANRTWGIWYFIFAILNGVARVYVGVHWPLDILGGVAVGVFSAYLAHRLLRSARHPLYENDEADGPPPVTADVGAETAS